MREPHLDGRSISYVGKGMGLRMIHGKRNRIWATQKGLFVTSRLRDKPRREGGTMLWLSP
jgi:hypothetical protein